MTREEAYIWNENSHDENYSTVKEMEESIHYLLKRIYDSFENRTCKNCKYVFSDTLELIYCSSPKSPLSSCVFPICPNFSCNKWEKNES